MKNISIFHLAINSQGLRSPIVTLDFTVSHDTWFPINIPASCHNGRSPVRCRDLLINPEGGEAAGALKRLLATSAAWPQIAREREESSGEEAEWAGLAL